MKAKTVLLDKLKAYWMVNNMQTKIGDYTLVKSDCLVELVYYCSYVHDVLVDSGYPGKAQALKDRYQVFEKNIKEIEGK